MSSTLLVWPVLAQMALTVVVYIRLLVVKRRAYATGQIDRARVSLHPSAWSDDVIVVNNNLANQFQTPVLFYVMCVLLIQVDAAGLVAAAMAWLFVVSRVAHAWVHLGSNHVPQRRRLFTVGLVIVLLMMLWAAGALLLRAIL